ncbi:stage II sporulation protein R [Sporomusaceae bacterium BoRhaA]|uniref:stage II sporulation protein R n=1 Tax=Pelorhabdus rhamnosifermentans TaxID=2772457 RepID=UPI001C061899|nr:stage II sporulation protein R [Pelorhabdus rhamnosifermentans]MBU2700163.1 stage II sporulation protein R [Pelorhabdus rhamnosifermentans]
MRKVKYVSVVSMIMMIFLGWILFTVRQVPLTTTTMSPEDVMRLHVLANSDTDVDQQIKYKVRDAIVAYLTPRLENITSQVEAREVIVNSQVQLIQLANDVLEKEHVSYKAHFEIGQFDFPIRSYGTLLFPAGRYEAVRILLGQGAGQNWWCVLFPPLCFIDGTHTDAVNVASLPDESASSQMEANQIQFKSKLAEIIESW